VTKTGLAKSAHTSTTNLSGCFFKPAGAFVDAYLGLGDNEEALAWFEKAYAEHSNIVQWMKVHPYMDPLREDPRFQDLLHRVGLDRTY